MGAVAAGDRVATPTGLEPGAVLALTEAERALLADWHAGKAGQDGGLPWWPTAIRRLELHTRLRLAGDPDLDAAWELHEIEAVKASPLYFTRSYGHLQPPEGAPIPFAMWVEQEEVLIAFWTRRKVIVLKARQLGLTWLALHYGYWIIAYEGGHPKVLALSKIQTDADKLVARVRRINELLPPYLRTPEARETRDSKSKFGLEDGGLIESLTGKPKSARSETARLILLDEFAFYEHGNAGAVLTGAQPTLGQTGQEIILSTGNGEVGDGEVMASEFKKAIEERSQRHGIFLPASVDRRRTPEWRATEIGNYETPEAFLAEHPETLEDALGGQGAVKVYPAADLAAALEIGRAIAALEQGAWLQRLVLEQGIEWGIDWGDFQTFAVYATALPGGGLLVLDELVQSETEPTKAGEAIVSYELPGMSGARFAASSADSAPVGTNRTFEAVLLQARRREPGRYPETHVSVPFGTYKEGGGERTPGGVNTVAYVRKLLRASREFTEAEGWRERVPSASGLLAILPRCETLGAQMGNLEKDPRTGKVRKPALDPRNPHKGDHGPDGLVALAHSRAEAWTMTLEPEEAPA